MSLKEFHYRWEFDLQSSPEQLWPLVADTNRFNRDTGVPSLESVGNVGVNGRRRLTLSTLGIPIEWEEQPFEWIRPFRFGVIRRYSKGPIAELRVIAELRPRENSSTNGSDTDDSLGTKLIYDVSATPRNILGFVAIPIQIGIVTARNFGRAFRRYDELAQHQETAATLATEVEFVPGGRSRLVTLGEKLVAEALDEELVALLVDYLENADDFAVSRGVLRAHDDVVSVEDPGVLHRVARDAEHVVAVVAASDVRHGDVFLDVLLREYRLTRGDATDDRQPARPDRPPGGLAQHLECPRLRWIAPKDAELLQVRQVGVHRRR